MINGKRVLALIPARGNSKRLPKKNILPLGDKPLICWTIDAAKNSQYVDQIIVSTDNEEIAKVCFEHGIYVPKLRPAELSTDEATTESVVYYVLKKIKQTADILVLLQPTSPLRNHKHIDEAIEMFEDRKAYSIVSVTKCEHPPEWSNTLPEDGSMKNFLSIDAKKRTQDIQAKFRLNGAIYIYNIAELLKSSGIEFQDETFAYKMPNKYSVDIDNEIDLKLAEFFMQNDNYK